MRKKMIAFLLILPLVLPVLCNTAAAKPFYEGKIIKLIVSTRPGGGYDFYGRMMAQYMRKYLPGSTIIVKNIPGAGHIIGTNDIYHAKPDGLTFGAFSSALPLAQVAEMKGVKFDLTKMSLLGSAGENIQTFFVSTKSPFKSVEDIIKADRVRMACGGAGSLNYACALLFAQMKGLSNIKIIAGYHGGEDLLAMMRGEIEAEFHSWGTVEPFVKDGHGIPIMFIGDKHVPGYENVPLLSEVVTEKQHMAGVGLLRSVCVVGRPFAGPPGIPKDRLEILRNAFKKACHDPEAIKMANKAGQPITFMDHEAMMKDYNSMLNIPPETREAVKKAYGSQ